MPLNPKDVLKWGPAAWLTRIVMLRPSEDGAMGVLFAFTRTVPNWPIAQADFVIKPVRGSAANSRFAEDFLAKTAGAKDLGSEGVRGESVTGAVIKQVVENFAGKAGHPWAARMKELDATCKGAGSFLIQRLATGMRDMGHEMKQAGGLAAMLRNATLMRNLGRLAAADTVLGIADRVEGANTGNIAFDADGNIIAIDSETVLARYESLVHDNKINSGFGVASGNFHDQTGRLSPDGFAASSVKAGQGTGAVRKRELDAHASGGPMPMPLPAASLEYLFNPAKLWGRFRTGLEVSISNTNAERLKQGQPPLTLPRAADWEGGKTAFVAGVLEGLASVDTQLSGLSWLRTKARFKDMQKTHGGDANMSYTTFKLRRLLAHLALQNSRLPEGKKLTMDQVHEAAAAYANKKLGHIAVH